MELITLCLILENTLKSVMSFGIIGLTYIGTIKSIDHKQPREFKLFTFCVVIELYVIWRWL